MLTKKQPILENADLRDEVEYLRDLTDRLAAALIEAAKAKAVPPVVIPPAPTVIRDRPYWRDRMCHGLGYCIHGDGDGICLRCMGTGDEPRVEPEDRR